LIWNVGSHYLKATILLWVAKAGVLKEHRRVLGYHEDPGDRSVFGYSRDIFAVPLREMERVIEAISDGSFLPDESRSGYWKKESKFPNIDDQAALELEERSDDMECSPRDDASTPRRSFKRPHEDCIGDASPQEELSPVGSWLLVGEAAESEPTIPESDDSSSHDSSSSDEADEASDDVVEQASGDEDLPKRGAKAPASNCSERVWVNVNTMRLHFGRGDDLSLLACGRPRGPQHKEVALHMAFVPGDFLHVKCKTCFGHIIEEPTAMKSSAACAALGDEEMLTSFFEVLAPVSELL
jgi:hypothetical protein